MRRSWLIPFLILILAAPLVSANTPQSKVYVVLWHGLNLDNLEKITWPEELNAAFALMNARVAGGLLTEGAYLSLGAGARAVGIAGAGAFRMADELMGSVSAGRTYTFHTGKSSSQIVHPGIVGISRGQQVDYTMEIGSLGALLSNGEKEIAAYGNSDIAHIENRWAALLAMNSEGAVFEGDVGENFLLEDGEFPYGVATDYTSLLEASVSSTSDIVVVDLGDPYRLDQYAENLTPERLVEVQGKVDQSAEQFLSLLVGELKADESIFIITPHTAESKPQLGQWLVPLVLIGQEGGLLISSTTRWPGIVTNIDLAPTLLAYLGISNQGAMIGRPMTVQEHKERTAPSLIAELSALHGRLATVGAGRGIVLRTLVGLQILGYLVALILLVIPRTLPKLIIQAVHFVLLITLAIPACLLLLPLHFALAALPLAIVIMGFARRTRPLDLVMVIALFTSVLIISDVILGAGLIRFSYLGYDALGGARYYGIGNEYMGILTGALIMGWAILNYHLKSHKIWGLGIFLFTLAVIAAPNWGTNVGGAITAVVGFGITWMGLSGIRLRLKNILLLMILVGVVLGGLMVLDSLSQVDKQSHIGRTASILRAEGLAGAVLIIQRKLSMNLKLFRYSIWSRALLVALAAMGASLIWPSSFISWMMERRAEVVHGLIGTLAASVAALIFNDSGVVAAATCIFFAATTMLILALSLKHDLITT